jgi:hypothetical protein
VLEHLASRTANSRTCAAATAAAALQQQPLLKDGCQLLLLLSMGVQVHLVEVSPFLRREQWKKLQCSSSNSSSSTTSDSSSGGSTNGNSSSGSSTAGVDQLPESAVSGLSNCQVGAE